MPYTQTSKKLCLPGLPLIGKPGIQVRKPIPSPMSDKSVSPGRNMGWKHNAGSRPEKIPHLGVVGIRKRRQILLHRHFRME